MMGGPKDAPAGEDRRSVPSTDQGGARLIGADESSSAVLNLREILNYGNPGERGSQM